jgi:ArsR family transcriptional regulator, arsenate/arsenite/antimonite-responsive transcriptional repressor
MRQQFPVIEENPSEKGAVGPGNEQSVARLTAFGSALSDPIRVQMLSLLVAATAEGRGCCGLPDLGAPAAAEEKGIGVCVCEFEEYFGMGQSKVSYHLRKLRDTGLVREEKRGKWSFYSLDAEAAAYLLTEVTSYLGLRCVRYE